MARNCDRQTVGRTGARYGTHSLGRTNASSDLRVRHGLADRDLLQGLPNPLLEGGATHIERQVKSQSGRFDKADDARHQGFVVAIATNQASLGKAVLKISDEFVRVVAEQDGRDALLA